MRELFSLMLMTEGELDESATFKIHSECYMFESFAKHVTECQLCHAVLIKDITKALEFAKQLNPDNPLVGQPLPNPSTHCRGDRRTATKVQP